jgi:hypothetical protein
LTNDAQRAGKNRDRAGMTVQNWETYSVPIEEAYVEKYYSGKLNPNSYFLHDDSTR